LTFHSQPYNLPEAILSLEREPLRLDQFLKLSGLTGTGGQAKILIQGGEVKVNGIIETRRRRKLSRGDVVEFDGEKYPVDRFLPEDEEGRREERE